MLYIIFVGVPFLLSPLVDLLNKFYLFGEFAEVLQAPAYLLYITWPVPFLFTLIALHPWFGSTPAFILVNLLGLLIVWCWSKTVTQRYGSLLIGKAHNQFLKWIVTLVSIFSWFIPLALLTFIALFIVNKLLGLPVGP